MNQADAILYAVNTTFLQEEATVSKRQMEQKGAQLLLQYALYHQFQLSLSDVVIEKGIYGKPFLSNYPHIHYNISHSGTWCVCALSQNPVGIDIEQMKAIPVRVLERFFEKGSQTISVLEQVQLWTHRESYGKLIGEGFFAKTKVPCSFQDYDEIDGYLVTVCTQAEKCNFAKKIHYYKHE